MTIGASLNHLDIQSTSKYAHANPAAVRDAMTRAVAAMQQAAENTPAT